MKTTCPHCGLEFTPNRDWQKFCSEEHQKAWHREQLRTRRIQAEISIAEMSKAQRIAAGNLVLEEVGLGNGGMNGQQMNGHSVEASPTVIPTSTERLVRRI